MLFRPLASAFIVGKCLASGSESDALMQSQTRNEDALEFVNNRVQLSEMHKSLFTHHQEYTRDTHQALAQVQREQGGYRAHLTQHNGGAAFGAMRMSSRGERMKKTARQMESEYRTILEMMVSGDPNSRLNPTLGNEYQPPQQLLGEVEAIFEVLIQQLGIEKDISQDMISKSDDQILKCHNAKENAFKKDTTGVNALMGASDLARGAHVKCRDEENKAICKTAQSCHDFNNFATCNRTDSTALPHAEGDTPHEQDWFAARVHDESHKALYDKHNTPTSLKQAIAKASKCRTDLIAEHSKSEDCDRKQVAFEEAFCNYAHQLEEVSYQYDACYEGALHNRYTIVGPFVQEKEEDGKLILTMIKKIKCYLAIFKEVEYSATLPEKDNVDACITLKPNVTELSLDNSSWRPDIAKDDLSEALNKIKYWPGGERSYEDDDKTVGQRWYEQEYSNASRFVNHCKNQTEFDAFFSSKLPQNFPAFNLDLGFQGIQGSGNKLENVQSCSSHFDNNGKVMGEENPDDKPGSYYWNANVAGESDYYYGGNATDLSTNKKTIDTNAFGLADAGNQE